MLRKYQQSSSSFSSFFWAVIFSSSHENHCRYFSNFLNQHCIMLLLFLLPNFCCTLLSLYLSAYLTPPSIHWHRLAKILGETKIFGGKGGNNWWKHGCFSIIEDMHLGCPACPPKSTSMPPSLSSILDITPFPFHPPSTYTKRPQTAPVINKRFDQTNKKAWINAWW